MTARDEVMRTMMDLIKQHGGEPAAKSVDMAAKDNVVLILADLAERYGQRLPTAKFMFVETSAGWRVDMVFVTGEVITGYEMFATKEEAALAMADRIIESGAETGRLS